MTRSEAHQDVRVRLDVATTPSDVSRAVHALDTPTIARSLIASIRPVS